MTKAYGSYFTLIALIHNILRSSSAYIRHCVVTTKDNPDIPLSYSDACVKHSKFRSLKGSKSSTKANDFFNYPKVGKVYQIELVLNRNPLTTFDKYCDRRIFLSGTWNEWLLESCLENRDLYGSMICDKALRVDLHKLTSLACPSFNIEGVNNDQLPKDEQLLVKTELFRRFSALSNLGDKARRLNL
jgi:hypothetical protein